MICISFFFFALKNVDRIFEEFKKYNYNPISNAHYHINENTFYFQKLLFKAEKEKNIDGKKFYIVLDRDLIKRIQLNK